MAIIKCKMCGGDIELSPDKTFGTCEYCGSTMTLPKIDDEQRAAAFNRGNHFRRIGEFDKALAVYERIVQENDADAEAHWCCALCRFGIEYVEDPASYEWLPTCHRASFDSFLEDVDYLAAVEHSDGITRRQYQKDAAKIAEVQRGILATSQNEKPFDVFICYKESDDTGSRTVDSTLAQDIYYQLTEQGRRVFFSRITLEDKAGTEYEPYIFAALNSAKVMIAVGTKPEHFNAVWVKNEWSRFLALMRKDRSKLLIPCYRGMDPYDLPEQLSVLQSYDMGKIGFIQDLIRGVAKVLDVDKAPTPIKDTVVVQSESSGNLKALLKRGYMALEDGEWKRASEFFEQVLNLDAECAGAYLGVAMASFRCSNRDAVRCNYVEDERGHISKDKYLLRAIEFASGELKEWFNSICEEREEACRKRQIDFERLQNSLIASVENKRKSICPARSLICVDVGFNPNKWSDIIVGVKSDGTVVIAGPEKEQFHKIGRWTDIVAVTGSNSHVVGLKSNGTVVAEGDNRYGACNVSQWADITAISAETDHTVGLRKDGTVVSTIYVGEKYKGQCEVSDWKNIVSVSAGYGVTVGLRADGTVIAAGEYNKDIEEWSDIVDIVCAGGTEILGLKSNGAIVSTRYGNRPFGSWKNICAISTGTSRGSADNGVILALDTDGKVFSSEKHRVLSRPYTYSTLGSKNVVSVFVGNLFKIGLKSDGTITTEGYENLNPYLSIDARNSISKTMQELSTWKLFNSIDSLEKEREDAIMRLKKRQEELKAERANLQTELTNLKGLFTGRRRKEIETRLSGIETELGQL